MTDKPDVAALVDWLQTWSPVTENGKRAHLAASELTRLAAENERLAHKKVGNVKGVLRKLNAAKAEIARLTALIDLYREGVRSDVTMEGPRFMGSNASALKRAWDADLDKFKEPAALKPDTGETP